MDKIKEQLNIMAEARDILADMGYNYSIINVDNAKKNKKDSTKVYINKDAKFKIYYEKSVQYIVPLLKNDEFGVMSKLAASLQYPSNSVKINNKIPTVEDLMTYLNLGRSRYYEIMKTLEGHNILKRVKEAGIGLVIYYNPYIYSSGRQINIITRDMFGDNIFKQLNE